MKIACFHILYILCKPSCIEAERHNVTLMSFLRVFTETIIPERKSFFSKLHDKCCQS